MSRQLLLVCACLLSGLTSSAAAQMPSAPRFEGTLLHITGSAETQVANDEAQVNFYVEVQDPDLARAQSQVNKRAADGVAALKRSDPKAVVETASYGSYPIYDYKAAQKLTGWRVRQSVSVQTTELANLSKTVAAAQPLMALAGIEWKLSRKAAERVESDLIQRAIANLNARVQAAAVALRVPPEKQRIEELNFETPAVGRPPVVAMTRMATPSAAPVAEAQLDAGQSTQQITVSAKVRLLP